MERTRLPLIINGVNFASAVERVQYTVQYEDRTGENSYMALNGDEYIDTLAQRPVITWPLYALTSAQLAQLQQAIYAAPQVQVYYFDTVQGAPTYGFFHGSIGPQRSARVDASGVLFRDMVLTLRSR